MPGILRWNSLLIICHTPQISLKVLFQNRAIKMSCPNKRASAIAQETKWFEWKVIENRNLIYNRGRSEWIVLGLFSPFNRLDTTKNAFCFSSTAEGPASGVRRGILIEKSRASTEFGLGHASAASGWPLEGPVCVLAMTKQTAKIIFHFPAFPSNHVV